MTVHYTSKKIMRENIILNALSNLELFKTLILNFAYIHSKRKKLCMFTFFSEMPICLSKQSKFPMNHFANYLHFQFLVT